MSSSVLCERAVLAVAFSAPIYSSLIYCFLGERVDLVRLYSLKLEGLECGFLLTPPTPTMTSHFRGSCS